MKPPITPNVQYTDTVQIEFNPSPNMINALGFDQGKPVSSFPPVAFRATGGAEAKLRGDGDSFKIALGCDGSAGERTMKRQSLREFINWLIAMEKKY